MSFFDRLATTLSGDQFRARGSAVDRPSYYDVGLPTPQIRVMDLLRRFPDYTDEQLNQDAFDSKSTIAAVHEWRVKAEEALKQYGFQKGPVLVVDFPAQPHKPTSVMTQEELRIRRTNLVEGAKLGRPFHEKVMLFFLRIWLLVGPVAFVALTTSEVAYILTRLVEPGDSGTFIIWGGALFIDLAMMFTTFGVAIKRRDLAEKREVNGSVAKREEAEVWFGTVMWLIFAAINVTGQSAFLLHIIQASHDPNMNILYIFVISRVVGFILGDAVTAFFLAKVDNSHLKLIARGEREKAALYRDIAQAEGERQLVEAKAEAEISLIRIRVQQEQEDAEFLANLKRQLFTQILGARPPSLPEDARRPSGARRLDAGS